MAEFMPLGDALAEHLRDDDKTLATMFIGAGRGIAIGLEAR